MRLCLKVLESFAETLTSWIDTPPTFLWHYIVNLRSSKIQTGNIRLSTRCSNFIVEAQIILFCRNLRLVGDKKADTLSSPPFVNVLVTTNCWTATDKRQESTRTGYSASRDIRRNHEIAVGGAHSRYNQIPYHPGGRPTIAKVLPQPRRNRHILRKVQSPTTEPGRSKKKIRTAQWQVLKLNLWFKNSQQTKVQDQMVS